MSTCLFIVLLFIGFFNFYVHFRQMYVVRFIKGGSFLHETTVQASYPTGGSSNKCNITQINVENVRKKCNCFNNSINMVEGGVGKTFFKINITSGRNCPIDHKVSCYTKC